MNKVQKYMQKCCVMAAHPECETYEEALKKDWILYCNTNFDPEVGEHYKKLKIPEIYKGLPCTLNRVLNAINTNPFSNNHKKNLQYFVSSLAFIKPDGSDALFEDQTHEKQLEIVKLRGYKE